MPLVKIRSGGQMDAENILHRSGIEEILQQRGVPSLNIRRNKVGNQIRGEPHQIHIRDRLEVWHQRDPRGIPNVNIQANRDREAGPCSTTFLFFWRPFHSQEEKGL